MGVMIGIAVAVAGIVGGAISRQLTDEFKAWTPNIIDRLIRLAVLRISEPHRERMNEEWRSHIDEIPGQIGKIATALGFLTASRKLRGVVSQAARPASTGKGQPDEPSSIVKRKVATGIHGTAAHDAIKIVHGAYSNSREGWVLDPDKIRTYNLDRIMQDQLDSLDGRE
jgi:hypothetical protein